MTWHIEVSVDCTVPTRVPDDRAEQRQFVQLATHVVGDLAAGDDAAAVGSAPSGIGGSAVNAVWNCGASSDRGSDRRDEVRDGCTTADGLSSTGVPRRACTLVAQLPTTIGVAPTRARR